MREDGKAKRLAIETIGYGLRLRRLHTNMQYFFDVQGAVELLAWLTEHQDMLASLQTTRQEQERKKG